MEESIKKSYVDLVNLFKAINDTNDPRVKDSLKYAIRMYVISLFEDEAGVTNPTIGIIEHLNENNIHVLVKKIGIEKHIPVDHTMYDIEIEEGIEYIIRYEDGINDDIEIVLNPGGKVI